MANGIIKLSVLTALVVTTSVASIPTFAQQDGFQKRGWRQGYGRGMQDGMRQANRGFMRRFTIIDANDDGEISDDEAAAQRESVFITMDADDDGELTEAEYMEVRMGTGEGRNKARLAAKQDQKRKRFAPMDTDKSGQISKTEWMVAGKARFDSADADSDGIVTPWEFRSQHRG